MSILDTLQSDLGKKKWCLIILILTDGRHLHSFLNTNAKQSYAKLTGLKITNTIFTRCTTDTVEVF